MKYRIIPQATPAGVIASLLQHDITNTNKPAITCQAGDESGCCFGL